MDISIMFLRLSSSKLAPQDATGSGYMVPAVLGWQRMAEPEKLTSVFQQTL